MLGSESKLTKNRAWFWPIYILLLLSVTLLGTEVIASFFVPPWPAREVRPISVELSQGSVAASILGSRGLLPTYNDWGMRDRPRSFVRPPDVHFRSVLVGDSFLEGPYVPAPLPTLIERRWVEQGRLDLEAINLGVSATGPRQYYYRTKHFGIRLQPDVVMLFVYSGNDFISKSLGDFEVPALAEELPVPSILGAVAPRTTWLIVNRLGLSEIGRNNKDIPGEFEKLNEWANLPASERMERVVSHMKKYYFPTMREDTIREVLSRGDGRLWTAVQDRGEFVAGWLLYSVIDWETGQWDVPSDAEEAHQMVDVPTIEATLSWLVGAGQIAKANSAQFVVALVPVGLVDPKYVDFWRPWPRYFSYNLSSDARHKRLSAALRQQRIRLIDLREDLDGVSGTYRLTDGHWTELGTQIVADRVSRELLNSSAR